MATNALRTASLGSAAALIAMLGMGCERVPGDNLDVGLVASASDASYFYSSRADIPVASQVYLAESGRRAEIVGVAGASAEIPMILIGSNPAHAYRLSALETAIVEAGVVVSRDTNAELPALSLTSCTSAEGIHYSVWRSDDRIWSAYRYLGYSVDPTCSSAELAE
ncbi:MAG: hypothetical protein R3305_01800 [Gammaproteobacteria bacterium]|nr:hypothetical protein [Gammaproteobacteria bacterium]